MEVIMKIIVSIFALGLILLFTSCKDWTEQFSPIKTLETQKYLGTWYEIARMPSSFEKDMTHVTANSSLFKDVIVKVLNKGLKNGKEKTAQGRAFLVKKDGTGHLRVSFFRPFYGDYIITDLADDYSWAMVISSTKLMWILSRTPKLDQSIVNPLVKKANTLGIDTSKLYFTPQNEDNSGDVNVSK